jgi:3-methyl-2-oxobutanoate hydroxymethyltransferase
MKSGREPIVALGVYESVTAKIADAMGVHIFMTGPSAPMSPFAHTNPTQIMFEEQLCTQRAVSRVTQYALINAHMPFLAYQASARDAVLNAGRLIAEGGRGLRQVRCSSRAHRQYSGHGRPRAQIYPAPSTDLTKIY